MKSLKEFEEQAIKISSNIYGGLDCGKETSFTKLTEIPVYDGVLPRYRDDAFGDWQ